VLLAARELDAEVEEAVVTTPAYFTKAQRAATVEVGALLLHSCAAVWHAMQAWLLCCLCQKQGSGHGLQRITSCRSQK
jgi:hypothetical protein